MAPVVNSTKYPDLEEDIEEVREAGAVRVDGVGHALHPALDERLQPQDARLEVDHPAARHRRRRRHRQVRHLEHHRHVLKHTVESFS